tara:strand:+ start:28 stop:318 length:291 start_codon:yes stop_codon:yes gene_type:complete
MKITFKVQKDFSARRVFTNVTNGGIEIEEKIQEFKAEELIENVSEYTISNDKKYINLKLKDYSTLTNVLTSNIYPDKYVDDSGGCSECEKKRKARI